MDGREIRQRDRRCHGRLRIQPRLQINYGPYGESSDASTGNPMRYTGRYLDAETGLYYYRARYYSPTLGRFLQTDPIGYQDDPNGYAYTGNDPVNGVDPTGMVGEGFDATTPCKTGSAICGPSGSTSGVDKDLAPLRQAMEQVAATGRVVVSQKIRESATLLKYAEYASDAAMVVGMVTPLGEAIDGVVVLERVGGAAKGLATNPFKGKSFAEIDNIMTEKGFTKVGPDAAAGKGAYFHPESGRKYYLDRSGVYREGTELPRVDVLRMRDGVNLEGIKRRYPFGESLIEPNP